VSDILVIDVGKPLWLFCQGFGSKLSGLAAIYCIYLLFDKTLNGLWQLRAVSEVSSLKLNGAWG
jgi:hypothetical protein